MDLRQLECFVHVAEFGSFTRASNFLSVAQPVLSRQVRALEVELRQTLLARNGRGVTVTNSGACLLEHGRGILAQVSRAKHALSERDAVSGRLVLAWPPSVSHALTLPFARAFRARFPQATLSVLEGPSTSALEWLVAARADLAVVHTAATSSAVDLTPILNERLYLVEAARGDGHAPAPPVVGPPVMLAELATHRLVMPGRPDAIRMRLEAGMARQSLKADVSLEIESVASILGLVLDDGYSTVLSRHAVLSSQHAAGFRLRPIAPPCATVTLWTAVASNRRRDALLDQAMPLLQRLMREAWLDGEQVGDATRG